MLNLIKGGWVNCKKCLNNMTKKSSFLLILSLFLILILFLGTVSAFTQVYDFTTNPASFTTNLAYYPVTGRILSTTKTVYVNYNGVDYNTLIDPYAKDYFVVIPLNAGTNIVTVKVIDSSNSVATTTKEIIYDSTYSTQGRELIYANTNYYLLPDIAHHLGVLVIDTKRNAFLGIIPDKTIQGITPDGSKIALDGEWYSTTTNATTGLVIPNYPIGSSTPYKILFSIDGYAYYYKYKLNLATNTALQMGSFIGFSDKASLSEDGSTIAYYNNSTNQGFLNTSTYSLTSANFNPIGGFFFSNLEFSPDKKYVVTTSSGGGGVAILSYDNPNNYVIVNGCNDWPMEVKFSSDSTKAFIGCGGNSYYGGGGVQIIDLTSLTSKGIYELYGARSLALMEDSRLYSSGTISYNDNVTGNVSAHGIYELLINQNGDGFNANKVFFVNLIGNVPASQNPPYKSSYPINSIFIKEGTITCSSNSDCGTNGLTTNPFCQSNNVYQNYTTYTCNNPGTTSSTCSSINTPQLVQICSKSCIGGLCDVDMSGVKIVDGKIYVNGTEFLIKGLDYAPWLNTQGPDSTQWQKPYPVSRTEDVTTLVTNNGIVNVKDYSLDGKIQAWEVIRFDVETMKKIGANTIRTYATGSWHDKDLDGIKEVTSNSDTSEIVQGDLPDWMIDELLIHANNNNMKVIIGYWVQEENFKEDPRIANWDDLQVAKQAFGRVVDKYKTNSAVLGWGIGNEVNGVFNQGWFSWGVNVNDYLNELFAYTRTLDTTHPIIYAKYIGENANFNNLTADIMSINAFTHSAQELIDYGEFSISAPQGKAYMLGEFGHILDQAEDHWELAKQYAGGAFLEYNNVWWKGDNHDILGVVDEFRAINSDRYNELNRLFGGSPVCNNNIDCGTNTTGINICGGKNVVRTNTIYTCNNPGTQNASCSTTQQTEIVETCSNTCSNGACVGVCSTNDQCGVSDWVIGTNICSNNDVYQNFKIYTCNNPGTTNSTCSNSIAFNFKTDCGDTRIGSWSVNYCNGNNVEKSRIVYNKGCNNGVCTSFDTTETQLVQTCANNCLNGDCVSACSRNSECGATTIVDTICKGNKLYNVKRYFTCNNARKTNSYCSSTDKEVFSKTCKYGCLEGECLPKPVCSKNSNCGRDVTSKNFCENGNVVKTGTVYTCLNPNTQEAVCDKQVGTTIVETCPNGCSNAKCLPPQCGFSDGIIVSAQVNDSTVWDISKIELKISYKVGSTTKTVTLQKNGNEIFSSEGSYSITNNCGNICNWVEGNQVIIGANNSDPSNWVGGKVSWKFDLGDIDPSTIKKVITKVYIPPSYGKGLHSTLKTGEGILKLEDITLAKLTTKKTKCGNDWFAQACSKKSITYSKTINSKVCTLP